MFHSLLSSKKCLVNALLCQKADVSERATGWHSFRDVLLSRGGLRLFDIRRYQRVGKWGKENFLFDRVPDTEKNESNTLRCDILQYCVTFFFTFVLVLVLATQFPLKGRL